MTHDFNPNEPSQGLGDTIAKITHAIGIDKVAEGVARAMGKEDCGCNKRRQVLNKVFPYQSNTPPPIPTPVDSSLYLYEGSRMFKLKTGFVIQTDNGSVNYKEGDVIEIKTTDQLYNGLQTLLENHHLEPYTVE